MALGRYAEGRKAAEDVLAVYETRLGADHPHSLICRLNIATALYLEGDYQAAGFKARHAADGLRDRLGPAHPYPLAAGMVLGSVLARQSAQAEDKERLLTEAMELEAEVFKERKTRLGPQHPDTLRVQLNLQLTEGELRVPGTLGKRQPIIGELSTLIGADAPDVITAIKGDRLLAAIDPLPF